MSSPSLSERAYEHIRSQVFSGELAPGARLVNRALASQLGTSFIPVREAISRLASEGLVEQVAGAGAFVRSFDRREIAEIYDVRELFEPFAAARAAKFLTDYETEELRTLQSGWEALGEKILARKRGATVGDLEQWLQINESFRQLLIGAARNDLLIKITNEVHVLAKCFAAHRGSPRLLTPELIESTLTSHRALVEALEKGDADRAETIVRGQLRYGRKSVLDFLDQTSEN